MNEENFDGKREPGAPASRMPFGMIVILVYMVVSAVQLVMAAARVKFLMLGPLVLTGTAAAAWNAAQAVLLAAAFWEILRRRTTGRNLYIGYLAYQALVPLSGYVTFLLDRQALVKTYTTYAPQLSGLIRGPAFATVLLGTTAVSVAVGGIIAVYLIRRKDYFTA